MKNLKIMSLMLALMACTFTFVSCGDDDEEEVSVTKDQLIGTWEMTHISGWFYDENDNGNLVKHTVNMDADDNTLEEFFKLDIFGEYWRYLFKQDVFIAYNVYYPTGSWQQEFGVPYSLNGNKIIADYSYTTEVKVEYVVLSISANQLVLKSRGEVNKEDRDLTITYKRI